MYELERKLIITKINRAKDDGMKEGKEERLRIAKTIIETLRYQMATRIQQ